jgi:hypothetical protein
MSCWLRNHEWGWPRRRGGEDRQVCVRCGTARVSQIQFRRNDQDYDQIFPYAIGQSAPALNLAARLVRLVRP